MPAPIYLPQKKNWWDPMMNQGSNFLWQLAMAKAQQKFKMELIDKQLQAEQIKAQKQQKIEREKEKRTTETEFIKQGRDVSKTAEEGYEYSEAGDIFVGPKTGEPAYKIGQTRTIKKGDEFVTEIFKGGDPLDPKNWMLAGRASRYKPTVNVNVNMTKKTQADLEEQIVKGKETLSKLDRVKNLYRPEFLEYMGKSKAWVQNKASKAGMPTGKYLKNYSKWKAEVDAHTFMWRKFITGVAGGEKEMEAIERTTINTKYDSPASFEAKLEQIKIMTDAAIARSKYLLERGFDIKKATPEQKAKMAEDYPLEKFGYKETTPTESKEESYDYEYVPGRGMLPVLR